MQESQIIKRCLPPNSSDKPITGKLTIRINRIVQSHSAKPLLAKIKFWGQEKHSYVEEGMQIVYTIHSTGKMLGQYFRDAGIGKLEFVDPRNNSQSGYSLINYLLYLKKVGPYNGKSGPFMLENTEIFCPILALNKKTIGQVQLLLSCEISDDLFKQTMSNFNRAQDSGSIKINSVIESKSPVHQQKQFDRHERQKQSNIASKIDIRCSKASHINEVYYDGNEDSDYVKEGTLKTSKFKDMSYRNQRQIQMHDIYDPQSLKTIAGSKNTQSYELQKIRLRLQAQELLGNKQSDHFPIGVDTLAMKLYQPQALQIIQIHSFNSLSLSKQKSTKKESKVSKNNQYIDLFINEDKLKKHCRIFPINNEGLYQSVLTVSKHAEIQLFLSNEYGKNKFKVCQLYEQNQIPIYGNKYNTIGTVKVILRPSGNFNPQIDAQNRIKKQERVIQKQTKEKRINANLNKSRQKQGLNTSNQEQVSFAKPKEQNKMLLISIQSVFHPNQPEPVVQINNHKWKYPYSENYIFNSPGRNLIISVKDRIQTKELANGLLPSHFDTEIVENNLRCTLVYDQILRMKEVQLHITLEIGNMKQVNYSINNRKQMYHTQDIQRNDFQNYLNRVGITSHQSNYQRQNIQGRVPLQLNTGTGYYNQNQRYVENQRSESKNTYVKRHPQQLYQKQKIHTQNDRRIETQPISEFNKREQEEELSKSKMRQSQNLINQEIYLVQMLSKGLHKISFDQFESKVQSFKPENQMQFIAFWNSLLNDQDPILVQILADMFIENQQVLFQEFVKCVNSYHNFVDLWWSLRVQALTNLLNEDPQIQTKILNESELGIINQSSLWNHALPKVSESIKAKINKIYHLSVHSPLPISEIFEDLKAVRNGQSRIPQESTSNLISDLAKVIKQTIQELITKVPQIGDQTVNIKSFADSLFDLDISISFWQSLLLIEQIKGWYATDLDLSEGVISAKTVREWMKAIVKKVENRRQSTFAGAKVIERIQKLLPEESRPDKVIEMNRHSQSKNGKQIQASYQNGNNQERMMSQNPSRSKLNSENNESDIFNIANLLRENDQMNLHTISQTKDYKKQNEGQSKTFQKGNPKILQDLQMDRSSDRSSQTQRSEPPLPQKQAQFKFFKVQIKQLKYLAEIKNPLKIQLDFTNEKNYFYFKKESDLLDKSFWQRVDINTVEKTSKGIQVFITDRQSSNIFAKGILPIDDIIGKTNKQRTIVIYDKSRNIIGKLVLRISVFDQVPKSKEQQSAKTVNILIEKIKPSIFLRMINKDTTIIQALKENQEHQIKINGDLYNEELIVQDNDGMVQGVIPLEELFFKQEIKGEYPLVNNIDGRFIGFIKLTIRNPKLRRERQQYLEQSMNSCQLKEVQNISKLSNQSSTLKNTLTKTKKRNECLVFYIDQLISFSEKFNKIKKQLTGNIYIKIMQTGQIVYKSEEIDHNFPVNSNLAVTKLDKAKYVIQKIEPMNLQFASQGKVIASCVLPAYPYSGFLSLNFNHSLTSKSQKNFALRLKVRVLRFPQTDYQISRVLNSLCQSHLQSLTQVSNKNYETSEETFLKQFKQLNKLTFTQINLIEQIIAINGKQWVFGCIAAKFVLNQDFIQQVLFHDSDKTGFLTPPKLEQLAQLCRLDLKLEDKQKRKEDIDIVPIIYGMMFGENKPFSKNRFKQRSAYQQIDNLHSQITKKYK